MTFESEWDRCKHWIEAAIGPLGGHSIEDVEALVRKGEVRFWAGRNAAMVTEMQVWPKGKWLLFWLAGGDLQELRDELRPMAEAYAKEHGCTRAYVVGRRGWVKALPGYEPVAWSAAKEL